MSAEQQSASAGSIAAGWSDTRAGSPSEQGTMAKDPAAGQRLVELETENREFVDRYLQIEEQYNRLSTLYVATTRLHSTLNPDTVVAIIQEIVINLIGAEAFAIYVFDTEQPHFELAAGEGLGKDIPDRIPWGNNLYCRVARSADLYLGQPPSAGTDVPKGSPLAIQPLKVEDELVGLLVVYQLLNHKQAFNEIDRELFELLAGRAAVALTVSQLHARAQRKASTLESLIGLLKETSTPGRPPTADKSGSST